MQCYGPYAEPKDSVDQDTREYVLAVDRFSSIQKGSPQSVGNVVIGLISTALVNANYYDGMSYLIRASLGSCALI